MRTTTRKDWRFTFTISDLGRFLCKSPVTLRGWESNRVIDIPREPSGDRKLTISDVRQITQTAVDHKRISTHRANLIYATMTLLEQIEYENNAKVK